MNFKGILLTTLSFFLCTLILFPQVPDAINYQAVARDGSGDILTNQGITVRMGVYEGAGGTTKKYEETHALSTNQFGLFSLKIGEGTPTFGAFAGIDWASMENHLNIEVDAGNGFVDMGKSQFVAAPYAMHAKTVEIDMVDDADNNPTNEIQTLSINGSDLSISGGNTVALPGGGGGGDITAVNAGTGITGGGNSGSVTLNAQTTTALWNANKLQGRDVLSNLPLNDQVLKWNGIAWTPAADATGGGSIWSQNGSNAYYNTGKVGIGTTSPSIASLEINGTGNYGAGIEFRNVASRFALTNTGGDLKFIKVDGSTFTPMTITSSGNIGIGTTSPTALLQITAAAGVDPLRVQLAGLTRLMVHDNGGVGIGYSTIQPPTNGMIVAGYIGIGISAPTDATMHIHEGSSSRSNIRFTNTTTNTAATDGCWVGYDQLEKMFVWNYENTSLNLGTNNLNRIHISSAGLVGIHDVLPSATLHIKQYGSSEEGLAIENDGDNDIWAFEIGGNDMNISFNGATKAFIQDTDGSWNTFSDRRMKKDIRNIEKPVLSGILKLNPVNYLMKDVEEGERTVGFIAQDVKKHFPELVNKTEDGYYYLNYDNFGVYAIKAIQEQQEQIEKLQEQEERIQNLENQVQQLMELMNK